MKTYHATKFPKDCQLFEPGIDSRQGWYTTNNMEIKATNPELHISPENLTYCEMREIC
jgi:hypothetical protein